MKVRQLAPTLVTLTVLVVAGGGCAGRRGYQPQDGAAPPGTLPRELDKISMPDYVIEPPDILLINATRLVPKPPYVIEPQDTLLIQSRGAPKIDPIDGEYAVEPEGRVNLGRSYGSVAVAGLTVEQAREAVDKQLKQAGVVDPAVNLAPLRTKPLQPIIGEHLVRPDGKVSLGTYGMVRVVGLTVPQAQEAIQAQLALSLKDPLVSVDIAAFNSKVYYVVFDGGGVGQQVYRLPATGNETVLDALAQVGGLSPVSAGDRMWIARPAPTDKCCVQTLPIDWCAITTGGVTATNYQIFPGDRLYVQAKPLVALDNALARLLAPAERVLGFTLLGAGAVQTLKFNNGNGINNGVGGIGGF